MNANKNESGSAAPATGPAAGAFSTTAITGAIAAAASAIPLGTESTFFLRRCTPVGESIDGFAIVTTSSISDDNDMCWLRSSNRNQKCNSVLRSPRANQPVRVSLLASMWVEQVHP